MFLQNSGIGKARLYTMKDYAVPSRNDQPEGQPLDTFEADKVMEALRRFATHPERCMLVLELENGREISIYPSLKAEATAFGEPKKENEPDYLWQIVAGVWPR
ncbi:MAG: hypothetical protein WAP51_00245 [Candidatus Sungiibacteriota bacterium]